MNSLTLLANTTADLGGAFSPERITYALEMTALGILAVFAVLALLWAVLGLFKVLFYNDPKKNEKKTPEVVAAPEVVVPTPIETVPVATQNNDATVAVIMAAISAYISSDPELAQMYSGGFRVVSFKRVRDKASWNSRK